MMFFFSQLRSARCWLRGGGVREREKRRKRQNERVNWMFSHPNARGFHPCSFREWRSRRRFREGIFLAALYPFGDVSSGKGGGGTFYMRLWLTRAFQLLSFNNEQVPEHLLSKRPPPPRKNQCPVFNSTSKPSKTKSLERSSPKRNARTTRRESRKSPRASKKSER